jgi:hypothetical protein
MSLITLKNSLNLLLISIIGLTKCLKRMGRFELGKVYDGDDIFSNILSPN